MIKSTLTLLMVILIQVGIFAQSAADFDNYNTTNTDVFTTNNFKAIAVGRGGHIWAGTQYGGLYKYDPNTKDWSKASALSNVFINDIKSDRDGGIWVAQSGKSGSVGGGGNIDGGINYFPSGSFLSMNFYSISGNGGLTSRNVRSLWIDSSRFHGASNPRVWAAQGSFITQFNATRGGTGIGLSNTGDHFGKITIGLDPYQVTIPSCLALGGNSKEVWVMAHSNYGKSQIIRYFPGVSTGLLRGGAYDHTNVPGNIFQNGFKASAIYFDNEGRQWIGLQSGGVIVKMNSEWLRLTNSEIFSSSVTINNNAITGDAEGNIYIGTSEGLVVFKGGDLSNTNSFYKYTSQDGLPSDNVSGIAIDTLNNQVLLTTANGVSFWKESRRIKITLAWDYSFPSLEVKLRGVAADGVARLYFKVKRGSDTVPKFKTVRVISHKYESVDKSIRGRLKVALTLDRYDEEASGHTFTDVERSDSTSDGNFWFWYVSPEDFSVDELGGNAEKSVRMDDLKVKVTFVDGTEDSTIFSVKVVRPPLLLVHGLASNPTAFDGLKHDYAHQEPILFTESPLFKYRRALVMSGRAAFDKNAYRLLSGDLSSQDDAENSLQYNIENLRRLGYAANQVDYLCHSMGGVMIRGAIGWYNGKFLANGSYKYNNYGKGFVHKMITVNTPHNSSPLADAVFDLIIKAPPSINRIISQLYSFNSSMQKPFDFIRPSDPSDLFNTTWKASEAIRDLQVTDRQGGVNLPATENVKNHRIVGDINLTMESVTDNFNAIDFAELTRGLQTNALLRIARDYATGATKSFLTSLFYAGYNDVKRAIYLFNMYGKFKLVDDFAGDGDFIVPLKSQTANKETSEPYITLFENPPGTGYDAMHVTIMGRLDVGNRILQLLNSPLNNNPAFTNSIEANTDKEPPSGDFSLARKQAVSVTSYFDTSAIVMSSPSRSAVTTNADSILQIKFRLKDTVGLAYININFQGNDSFRISRDAAQEITFKVNGSWTGNQMLMATAVYDKGANVEYYTDTLNLMVDNLGILQGFRIKEEEVEVTDEIFFHPQYEARYNNEWIEISPGDPALNITFTPAEVVGLDMPTLSFKALGDGFAQAYFSYKGFRDTLSFNARIEIPVTNLLLSGKVLLQGAYNAASGKMNTILNSSGILSQVLMQPYSDTVFNYFGREKVNLQFLNNNPSIVDWILVELRDPDLPTAIVATRAGFIKNDGTLMDTSGTNGITFSSVPPGNYYIVLKHRNHIAVRSSGVIDFTGNSGSVDFTKSVSTAFAGSVSNQPLATLTSGNYGMWGGNASGSRTVKMTGFNKATNDYLQLLNTLGNSTNTLNNIYSGQDINMDGKVNMTGNSPETNDYLKLREILGTSINQIHQPAF